MIPDIFISLINTIVSVIGTLIQFTINLLPNSPFASLMVSNISSEYLSHLAWVVPIESILTVFSSSLVAVTIFYIYQVLLRWIKAID